MPLFGACKQKKHFTGRSNYSTTNLNATPYPQPTSPPPPYHFHPDPALQYPAYPQHGPYSQPQPSSADLVLRPHPQPGRWHAPWTSPSQKWSSCTNLPALPSRPPGKPLYDHNTSGRGLYDYIGDKFSDVVSLIDEEVFTGGEKELIITFDPHTLPSTYTSPPQPYSQPAIRSGADQERALVPFSPEKKRPPDKVRHQIHPQDRSINVTSKISLYANSHLPASLPPLRLYMSSWPLICLAAQYSNNAYKTPVGAEKDTFVRPDARLGTKAMVIKSVPIDDMNTIVFAIRGTSLLSLRDWGINLTTDPVSPVGFLDDPGNLAHSGFLRVARAMAAPIAARLRHLLEENPSRAACSLLITGHSAGGAVAALLYAHMLAESQACQSELNNLTGCFKRIHCITFGAPPVTLLPLWKPANSERRLRKSLFLGFINEGDVVSRAEKPYIKSIIELLASPTPGALKSALNAAAGSRLDLSRPERRKPVKPTKAIWKLPPATLSNAGRLVVLRVQPGQRERDVTASIVTDQQLRGVVFGNPIAHMMDIYARRIQALATKAVTGGAGG